jgi:hypothetical protein
VHPSKCSKPPPEEASTTIVAAVSPLALSLGEPLRSCDRWEQARQPPQKPGTMRPIGLLTSNLVRAPRRCHRAKGLNETPWLWRDAPNGM